jgi:hypothetical protein
VAGIFGDGFAKRISVMEHEYPESCRRSILSEKRSAASGRMRDGLRRNRSSMACFGSVTKSWWRRRRPSQPR